jgi:hypothetical protein
MSLACPMTRRCGLLLGGVIRMVMCSCPATYRGHEWGVTGCDGLSRGLSLSPTRQSSEAASGQYSGEKPPSTMGTEAMPMNYRWSRFFRQMRGYLLAGVLVLFVLAAVSLLVGSLVATPAVALKKPLPEKRAREVADRVTKKTKPTWRNDDHSKEAWVLACEECKRHLKTPRVAKFPSVLWDNAMTGVSRTGQSQSYVINSWVDSQNAYGAMLRIQWTARLRKIGPEIDNWVVDYFTLHEE